MEFVSLLSINSGDGPKAAPHEPVRLAAWMNASARGRGDAIAPLSLRLDYGLEGTPRTLRLVVNSGLLSKLDRSWVLTEVQQMDSGARSVLPIATLHAFEKVPEAREPTTFLKLLEDRPFIEVEYFEALRNRPAHDSDARPPTAVPLPELYLRRAGLLKLTPRIA